MGVDRLTFAPLRGGGRVRSAPLAGRCRAGLLGSGGDLHGGDAQGHARGERAQDPASGTCSLRQLIEYENALADSAEPARRHRRPERHVRTGLRHAHDHAIARDPRARGAHHNRGRVPGRLPGTSVRHPEPRRKAPARHLRAQDRGRDAPTPTKATANSAATSAIHRVAAPQRRLDHRRHRIRGGGIANDAGTLVLERSLVSGNHATTGGGEGGGIQNYGSANCDGSCSPGKKAVLAIEDSTVAENDAASGCAASSAGPKMESPTKTVSRSSTRRSPTTTRESLLRMRPDRAQGSRTTDGTIDVVGSIVAYNSENRRRQTTKSTARPRVRRRSSPSATTSRTGPTAVSNPPGTNRTPLPISAPPRRRTTAATPTPSLPNGPARRSTRSPPAASFCDGLDQRGITRPQGAGCDIGAVELAPSTFQATGVPVSATADAQFNGTVATFTEAVPDTVASDYTATIDWGDGTSTTAGTISAASGGGFAVSGSHTYASGGAYHDQRHDHRRAGRHRDRHEHRRCGHWLIPPAPRSPAPPTLVTTSPPTVITTTSAAFTTTVNPQGLATRCTSNTGRSSGGASAAAVTYGSVTPDQTVGLGLRQPHGHRDGHRPAAKHHVQRARGGDQQRRQRDRAPIRPW